MKPIKILLLAFALALIPISARTAPPLIMSGTNVLSSTNELPPAVPPADEGITPANVVTLTNATQGGVTNTAPPPRLSPPVREVVKMAASGVTDEVLTSYIQNSPSTFNLTPDHIIYLQGIGMSAPILGAMLSHDRDMRDAASQQQLPTSVTPQPYQPPTTMPGQPYPDQGQPQEGAPQDMQNSYPYDGGSDSQGYSGSAPIDLSYFVSSLSPYGNWQNMNGCGWCWQPQVACNPGWTPYCNDGQWLNSNCGWYWHSHYPWGWAPFHYGRWWRNPKCGWVWFPGSQWAPSWVCWRNSQNCCGWAPLSPFTDSGFGFGGSGISTPPIMPLGGQNFPPVTPLGASSSFGTADDFTFVPNNHFGDQNLVNSRLTSSQKQTAFSQSKLVGDSFATDPSGNVINRGVSPSRVSAAGGSRIPQVNVQDTPGDGQGFVPGNLSASTTSGFNFTTFRPNMMQQPQTQFINPNHNALSLGASPAATVQNSRNGNVRNPQTQFINPNHNALSLGASPAATAQNSRNGNVRNPQTQFINPNHNALSLGASPAATAQNSQNGARQNNRKVVINQNGGSGVSTAPFSAVGSPATVSGGAAMAPVGSTPPASGGAAFAPMGSSSGGGGGGGGGHR